MPNYVDESGVERFVVKVQVSLSGNPGTLVYNRDQSVEEMFERDLGERLLGSEIKGFFWAYLEGTILHFEKEAPWQDW